MRLHRLIFVIAIAAVFVGCESAHANVMITIDKSSQKMTVTVNGEDRYVWPVSTGRHGYDTPSGEFQPFRMERDHFSREWDDAPMPNSIFFTKIGHAIHGTYETRNLGRPVSHGCVRLAPQNAAKLYALVKEEGLPHTRVRLTGATPRSSDVPVASRERTNDRERQAARRAENEHAYAGNFGTAEEDVIEFPRSGASEAPLYYRERPYYREQPRYYERRVYRPSFFFPFGSW
ncbi:MAG TPA: L,D-transpeptidase [Pseudolabrys sp.]|nr:L,D-transpeptidase [Pseudolabrys sp.]